MSQPRWTRFTWASIFAVMLLVGVLVAGCGSETATGTTTPTQATATPVANTFSDVVTEDQSSGTPVTGGTPGANKIPPIIGERLMATGEKTPFPGHTFTADRVESRDNAVHVLATVNNTSRQPLRLFSSYFWVFDSSGRPVAVDTGISTPLPVTVAPAASESLDLAFPFAHGVSAPLRFVYMNGAGFLVLPSQLQSATATGTPGPQRTPTDGSEPLRQFIESPLTAVTIPSARVFALGKPASIEGHAVTLDGVTQTNPNAFVANFTVSNTGSQSLQLMPEFFLAFDANHAVAKVDTGLTQGLDKPIPAGQSRNNVRVGFTFERPVQAPLIVISFVPSAYDITSAELSSSATGTPGAATTPGTGATPGAATTPNAVASPVTTETPGVATTPAAVASPVTTETPGVATTPGAVATETTGIVQTSDAVASPVGTETPAVVETPGAPTTPGSEATTGVTGAPTATPAPLVAETPTPATFGTPSP